MISIAQVVSYSLLRAWDKHESHALLNQVNKLQTRANMGALTKCAVQAAVLVGRGDAAILSTSDPGDLERLQVRSMTGFKREYSELREGDVYRSISGEVARLGRTRFIPDLRENEQASHPRVSHEENFVSCLVVPVSTDIFVGALSLFVRERKEFRVSTQESLEFLGRCIASAIEAQLDSMRVDAVQNKLAIAAHAVRSPITKLSQDLDELHGKIRRNQYPESLEIFPLLFAEIDRSLRRVDTLLYEKGSALQARGTEKKMVALSAIVMNCVDRHRRRARREEDIFVIAYDSVKTLPRVWGDADLLDLLVDNLVENAVKYAFRNTTVEVRGAREGGIAVLTVCDLGLGIPEQHYEQIFEDWYRSPIKDGERFKRGTGLGLNIVQRIAKAHHATVQVQSEPEWNDKDRIAAYEGYRTIFTVRIPIKER